MSESSFWRDAKSRSRNLWQRIESLSTGRGIPDSCILIDGVTVWAECKDVAGFVKGLGTTGLQRLWLRRWCEHGGRAFLAARVKHEVFLVQGWNVLVSATRPEWFDVADAVMPSRALDIEAVERVLRDSPMQRRTHSRSVLGAL